MAHTFISPTVIAQRALATLYNTTVLAGLVFRDYDAEFNGKVGDTVNVRTPGTFEAKVFDRANGIELQDITETSIPVVLDTILDVSFPVTTEELTLEIDDFATRLLNPAMEAIVQSVDGRLAEALIDAATATATGTEPNAVYRDARAKLSREKAPLLDRFAVLSPESVSTVLGDDLIVAADKSGWTDALRNANVGRLFGIESFESNVLGGGDTGVVGEDADTAEGVAFHRDAIALVSRTLEAPMGVAGNQVAIENYKGLGLRVVRDYDIDKKQDVISVDFLMGVKPIRPEWAVELNLP